jgi:hypothetical protein
MSRKVNILEIIAQRIYNSEKQEVSIHHAIENTNNVPPQYPLKISPRSEAWIATVYEFETASVESPEESQYPS